MLLSLSRLFSFVMPGLDPGIHPFAKPMDQRAFRRMRAMPAHLTPHPVRWSLRSQLTTLSPKGRGKTEQASRMSTGEHFWSFRDIA
jgi:hypothetical protein